MTTERNPEMSRNRAFETRAWVEVERIKAQEAAEEERKQARLRELAEQVRERREAEAAEQRRRKEERDAKLRHSQEEKAEGEERLARDSARRSWKASGGTEAAFDRAWPSMWEEMLKRPTADADRWVREVMARSNVSRIQKRRRDGELAPSWWKCDMREDCGGCHAPSLLPPRFLQFVTSLAAPV
jgi:hypothetical protein